MGAKILVVDDEPNLLRLIGYALEVEGYQVATADNGVEALEKVQAEQPDLLILDVMLPDMSGLEVCEKLRGDPQTEGLPIIMLSARTQVPDKIKGLKAGADEYVTKPVDSDEMVARVAALLERTRRLSQAPPAKPGKVLGFFGAKGGVGTSTVALNVALALAKGERTAIAVELRPYFGTFSLQLGQTPAETLTALLELEPEDMDAKALEARLVNCSLGLRVLFGPPGVDACREIRPDQAEALVEGLADMADYVILDLPCCPSEATQAALRRCDFVTLVLEPEPSCVTAGKVVLEGLRSWGVREDMIGAAIVNRAGLAVQMLLTEILPEIRTNLGCGIVGVIPAALDLCVDALRSGSPLMVHQPNNIVAITLSELADRLAAAQVTPLEVF